MMTMEMGNDHDAWMDDNGSSSLQLKSGRWKGTGYHGTRIEHNTCHSPYFLLFITIQQDKQCFHMSNGSDCSEVPIF